MKSKDELGDRMKMYERTAEHQMLPLLPILARVDGRSFHTFTKGMARPFDLNMQALMSCTAQSLLEATCARTVYVQSDEITLLWYSNNPESQVWFGGRHSKMVSQLGALATLYFNEALALYLPAKLKLRPTFDARVWQVPNQTEAANVFLWREQDATRNSIQMAAQSMFSSKELHGKDTGEQQELMFQRGVNWNDYTPYQKRGLFIQRQKRTGPFTVAEINDLPPKHAARKNPNLQVERTVTVHVDMPPFGQVVNRVGVLFDGAAPLVASTVVCGGV